MYYYLILFLNSNLLDIWMIGYWELGSMKYDILMYILFIFSIISQGYYLWLGLSQI